MQAFPSPREGLDQTPKSPTELLQRLFENGDYADYTVKCGERFWPVHRAIICSRSKYFKTACEQAFVEGVQGVITLQEDDPELIEALLLFLYTMNYPGQPSAPRKSDDLIFHAKVYGIGDEYNVLDLKDKAKKAFEQFLRKDCDLALFPDVASLVYNLTVDEDRGLRDILLDSLWANKATLLPRRDIQDFIMGHVGFQKDVLHRVFLDSGSSMQKNKEPVDEGFAGWRPDKSKKKKSGWLAEETEAAVDPDFIDQWGVWKDFGNCPTPTS